MENKTWRCSSDGKDNIITELKDIGGLPLAIAMYLASRGITVKTQKRYFEGGFADLSDPFRFTGMENAVKRLWKAIRNREYILIHGDYDTDGITATALLSSILEHNGGLVYTFLPHRFDDGYGFTPESLTKALETLPAYTPSGFTPESLNKALENVPDRKCGVLVTVDCGINSTEAVQEARKMGIDVIITDHHEPADALPEALAVLNPKIYPEDLEDLVHLSGVGVAFKLAHAFILYGRMHNIGGFETDIQDVLDYVALGTVADIVPLLGENRILVRCGMETLKSQIRPGVCALIEHAHVGPVLQPSDITFKLAPRLNAAGRLGNASSALELMKETSIVDAQKQADRLEDFNKERQEKEQEIFAQAKCEVESDPDYKNRMSIIAAGENWHQGVIGIVASRFARDYNRPAIVLTIIGDEAHGSGRSVGSLNLIRILSKCSHLLTRYGGHPMAVGLGLPKDKIQDFKDEFERCVREEATPADLISHINYDGSILFHNLNDQFFAQYSKLGPFGHSNPAPLFLIQGVDIFRLYPIKPVHTKGVFMDAHGDTFDFIAFNRKMSQDFRWDVLVEPQINEFNGKRQLFVKDCKPVERIR